MFNDQIIAKEFVDNFLAYLNDFEYMSKKFNNFNSDLKPDTSIYMSWILLQYEGYFDFLKMLVDLFRTRHNYIKDSNNLYKKVQRL